MTITKNHYLTVICVCYVISWLIPISPSYNNMIGYEGAEVAYNDLVRGLSYFANIISANTNISLSGVLKNIVIIIAGLPNILFILSAILLFLNKKFALYFAAPSLLSMALWIEKDINLIGGFGLWLLTGLGLFVLAANLYKSETNVPYHRLFISGPLITSYIIVALIAINELLYGPLIFK